MSGCLSWSVRSLIASALCRHASGTAFSLPRHEFLPKAQIGEAEQHRLWRAPADDLHRRNHSVIVCPKSFLDITFLARTTVNCRLWRHPGLRRSRPFVSTPASPRFDNCRDPPSSLPSLGPTIHHCSLSTKAWRRLPFDSPFASDLSSTHGRFCVRDSSKWFQKSGPAILATRTSLFPSVTWHSTCIALGARCIQPTLHVAAGQHRLHCPFHQQAEGFSIELVTTDRVTVSSPEKYHDRLPARQDGNT